MQDLTKFERPTYFLGRNGEFKAIGIFIERIDYPNPGVTLTPQTSKGMFGRCAIKIPADAIPAVIERLQKCMEELAITQLT